MDEIVKFWLVWCPTGPTPPSHRHMTQHAARNEATRLAALHPGREFFVLEATGLAKKVEVTWTPITVAEIPF